MQQLDSSKPIFIPGQQSQQLNNNNGSHANINNNNSSSSYSYHTQSLRNPHLSQQNFSNNINSINSPAASPAIDPPYTHSQPSSLTNSHTTHFSQFNAINNHNNHSNHNNQSLLSSHLASSSHSSSTFFNNTPTTNSYTPFHNTPNVISSSYSNNNSLPTPNYFNSFHHHAQPTTTISHDTATFSSAATSSPKPIQGNQHQQQHQQQHPHFSDRVFSSSVSQLTLAPTEPSLDILNHPANDLLLMLSALLEKIVDANDKLHPQHYDNTNNNTNNKFTANVLAFHGRNVPAISLHAYLTRILKYCPVTNEVFLTLLVYFDRIAKRANSQNDNEQLFVMDSYNIHRLIIAGITVASKFFSDIFYKNSRYAKVGGLPLEELNHLELQFLLLTDFKLMIQIEELQRYADLLLKFWYKNGPNQPNHSDLSQSHESAASAA